MFIKNIELNKVLNLKDEVQFLPGQIVSKTLVQNQSVSLTVFSFDKETEISTHESNGDAMVFIIEGEGTFTVGNKKHLVKEGETLIMPANIPHAVFASEKMKMLLTVIF